MVLMSIVRQVEDFSVELQAVSNGEYILYHDENSDYGFEIQFDNGEFNGKIYVTENVETDEWYRISDSSLYDRLKEVAIIDYRIINRTIEDITRDILTSKSLEDLCYYLDSCWDLYDLGYIDCRREQAILEDMAEETALCLWAIHQYANTGDVNKEYTFNHYVKHLEEKLDGINS
jgi:hypothetical protein